MKYTRRNCLVDFSCFPSGFATCSLRVKVRRQHTPVIRLTTNENKGNLSPSSFENIHYLLPCGRGNNEYDRFFLLLSSITAVHVFSDIGMIISRIRINCEVYTAFKGVRLTIIQTYVKTTFFFFLFLTKH
jgi:hypothetical protein